MIDTYTARLTVTETDSDESFRRYSVSAKYYDDDGIYVAEVTEPFRIPRGYYDFPLGLHDWAIHRGIERLGADWVYVEFGEERPCTK